MKYFGIIEQDAYAENPRDDMDCLGTLYTWHKRYTIGGKNDENNRGCVEDINLWIFDNMYGHDGFKFTDEAMRESMEKFYTDWGNTLCHVDSQDEVTTKERAEFDRLIDIYRETEICIIPVFMYDHSGITIRTGPFSCPWDSGQVGFIYCTRKDSEKLDIPWEDVDRVLRGEVEMLDQFLTGDVFDAMVYSIEDEDDEIENETILEQGDRIPKHANLEESCGGFYGYDSAVDFCKSTFYHLLSQKEESEWRLFNTMRIL